jgi:hypothetical protein
MPAPGRPFLPDSSVLKVVGGHESVEALVHLLGQSDVPDHQDYSQGLSRMTAHGQDTVTYTGEEVANVLGGLARTLQLKGQLLQPRD